MTHGGKRIGAGRIKGSTKYGECTRPIRIPQSRVDEVKAYLTLGPQSRLLPLFSCTVRAGLPTTADDNIEDYVDLNCFLSKDSGTTFLVRASGDSMINTPIFDGDMLVVEREDSPSSGKIVIAALGDELTVKRLHVEEKKVILLAENPSYQPIVINEEHHFKILGVVTHVIHQTR